MTTHVDRLEVSSLPDLGMPPGSMFAPALLSAPVEAGETNLRTTAGGLTPASLFTDQPIRNEPEIYPALPIQVATPAATPSFPAAFPPATPGQASGADAGSVGERPFPPLAEAGLQELVGGLSVTGQEALREVYGAFLSNDDPYLETGDLSGLAERLGVNEGRLRDNLCQLGSVGLLRLARHAEDGEIELAESTTRGMEAFCRVFRPDTYPTLLEKVGRAVVAGEAEDGLGLRAVFPAQPGLLLNHVVETLARDGWLECDGQFGASCDGQIGRVTPDLRVRLAVA